MKDLTQQPGSENTLSTSSRISPFLLEHKNHFILLLLFLLYGFILIPLGDYKHPEASHTGYYSIQRIEPEDKITHFILADANFIHGDFAKAKFHYLKVINKNKNSPANFQLDRIEVLAGKTKLSLSRLTEELNKGDPDGNINRWLGIHYMDILKQPDKSIHFFKRSLNINPTQKHANALKNIIHQHFQQKKRLLSRKISSNSLPQTYHAFLNTYINFVRLNVILIDQQL